MRLGKTRIAVADMDRLLRSGYERILVVGPQLALTETWRDDELPILEYQVYDLSSGSLNDRRFLLTGLSNGWKSPAIVLVNWEALHPLRQAIEKWGPEAVYFDESQAIKNPSAKRTTAATKIARKAKVRRIMTGTPIGNSYSDLFCPMRALDNSIFGSTLKEFREKWGLVMHPVYKSKVIGYTDLPKLQARVAEFATILRPEDVFDQLPPVTEDIRRFDLSPPERATYDALYNDMVVSGDGWTVDATHQLARMVKASQVTAGFLIDTEGNVHPNEAQTKINLAADIALEDYEAGESVVIFYLFKEEGKLLAEALKERRVEPSVTGILSGGTKPEARSRFVQSFNKREQIRIMLVQESVGGAGISLIGARHDIFCSTSFDFIKHSQARGRIFHPGVPITHTYLLARNSVDNYKFEVITGKRDIHDDLMKLAVKDVWYA